MKDLRLCIILLWLQLSTVAYGQIAESKRPDVDIYWRKYVLRLEKELAITDLATAAQPNALRLWANGQVIEIWQENKSTQGYLLQWAKEVVPYKEEDTGRYFSIKEALDSIRCTAIERSAVDYSIRAIPNGDSIPGWGKGFDGIEYIIETKQSGHYTLKTYWTPSSQRNLIEAESVQAFVDGVFQTINAPDRRKYFQESIPFNSWTTDGGSASVSKVKTYAEYMSMKQERNRYRRLKKGQLQSIE